VERKDFIGLIKDTYGVVHQYREAFHTYLSKAVSARADLKKISPEAYKTFEQTTDVRLKQTGFSDSMVFFAPLMNIGERLPLFSVIHLMYGASGVFIAGLESQCPSRGAIEVGIAGDFPDTGIYGPVLYKAYELESRIADYPRIVLGVEFVNYLRAQELGNGTTPNDKLRRALAKTCKELVYVDIDGVPCLDYLGKPIRELMDPSSINIEGAIDFATAEWERFKHSGDPKLARRYFQLLNYLQTRNEELWKREIKHPD